MRGLLVVSAGFSWLAALLFSGAALAGPEITAERAREIALAETGGGTVAKCELDFEHGRKVYEIEIIKDNTKHKLEIGAAEARIYAYEAITYPGYNPAGPEITAERAREIALAETGGGTVAKCELDFEHGRKVYEIEIINGNTKHELEIGAAEARIYEHKQKTIVF